MITNSNISRQGEGYTDSLSKEEIEKETSAVIDYYNAYLKNSTKFNYRSIRKICSCSRQKGPKSAGEAMTQETRRDSYPTVQR